MVTPIRRAPCTERRVQHHSPPSYSHSRCDATCSVLCIALVTGVTFFHPFVTADFSSSSVARCLHRSWKFKCRRTDDRRGGGQYLFRYTIQGMKRKNVSVCRSIRVSTGGVHGGMWFDVALFNHQTILFPWLSFPLFARNRATSYGVLFSTCLA